MAQVPIDVEYKGVRFEKGFRADLIINGIVIIELKSVELLTAAHRKQLQTYHLLAPLRLCASYFRLSLTFFHQEN
jgi:GxxExxY protein